MMKKIGRLMVAVMMSFGLVGMVGMGAAQPVWAEDTTCPEGQVPTAILGEGGCFDAGGDDGKNGVITILMNVIDIMTVGVGILGVIGITWAGLTYLTAGGSEEKTRLAKRRIYEIVIGLVAYVLIYAILKWLLPGFAG